MVSGSETSRTKRRVGAWPRQLIGEPHEEQLRLLLDHVRDGFTKMDAGEVDPFDLDGLIHHYKRSAQKRWSFCGSGGGAWEHAALLLEWEREHAEPETDWWEVGRAIRRRAT